MTRRSSDEAAIVVVNYNSAEFVESNLGGDALEDFHGHVVVVDNFHSQLAREQVRCVARRHGWDVVCADRNGGFGVAVNLGVARALELGYRTFVLVNPDARLSVESINLLHRQSRDMPTAAVSPRIDGPTGEPWFVGMRVDRRSGRTVRVLDLGDGHPDGSLTGACLAFSDELWRRTGGFDPSYFLYWEDVDFSWRVLEAGGSLLVRDDVRAYHDVGGTQGSGNKSAVYVRYMCRNRLLFATRRLSRREQLRWLLVTPQESKRILFRSGRRHVLRHPDLLLAALVGSTAGCAAVVRSVTPRIFPTTRRTAP